uniref:Uncharacterized protein n=1 Tax=Romanomermis culicivorax TaxID=13658 RepID=A0A915HF02_ROMCU
MPKVSHMPPDHTHLPSRSSLQNATTAMCRTLNFDQTMPPPTANLTQMAVPPVVSLPLPNLSLSLFSNSALDGTTQAQAPPTFAAPAQATSLRPPSSGQSSIIAAATCASASAVSQIPPPRPVPPSSNDPTIAPTISTDSFINIDPWQAPAETPALVTNHRSSLVIANTNEVHNFQIEAHDALEQFSTPMARITNNIPTVQTIDQIIGAVSDQFQAQQLRVQREIQEQVQSINARFTALAEQMQQLISTTTLPPAVAHNPPTPRPPLVTSPFHGEEPGDIYIPNETLCETEPALVFGCPPAHIKPKALSTDTLYSKEFSCTACGKDEISPDAPQRCPPPPVKPFGFLDYPPEHYYDYPQPGYKLPRTSHREADS